MPMFHSTKWKGSMLFLHLKSPSLNLLVWFELSLVACCKIKFYEPIHNVMIWWRTDIIYNAEQYCLTWSILQIIESENNTNIENFKHIVIEDLNTKNVIGVMKRLYTACRYRWRSCLQYLLI